MRSIWEPPARTVCIGCYVCQRTGEQPLAQLRLQSRLHRGPLCGEDRVVGRVARRPGGAGLVCAQHPVEVRAEAFDGAAGTRVALVGLERDAKAAPGLESVLQEKQLRLGVDGRSLPLFGKPSVADLRPVEDALPRPRVQTLGPLPAL